MDKLEEFMNKLIAKTSSEVTTKAAADAQAATAAASAAAAASNTASANVVVEQVASFIEELKDFIDDRLVDTACQLELSNQRVGDLHMSLNFLIGEITYLKYQNQELKSDMHLMYQDLKQQERLNYAAAASSTAFQCGGRCVHAKAAAAVAKAKKKNKSTDMSGSVTASTASTSSTELNAAKNNARSNQVYNYQTYTTKDNTNTDISATSSNSEESGGIKLRRLKVESSGDGEDSIAGDDGGGNNYGSSMMCSALNDNDEDTASRVIEIVHSNRPSTQGRYYSEKRPLGVNRSGVSAATPASTVRNIDSFDNSLDSEYKLDWPPVNKALAQQANPGESATVVNNGSKLEADILFIRNLINSHQKNGKMTAFVSTELGSAASNSGRSLSNVGGSQQQQSQYRAAVITGDSASQRNSALSHDNTGGAEGDEDDEEEEDGEGEEEDRRAVRGGQSSSAIIKKFSISRAKSN
jgi:hypothetical protein